MKRKFKIAHLIGSTKENEALFRHVETELTKQGYICFAPVIYGYENYKPYLEMLTDMCTEKLWLCDIIVVATPDHIGESTIKRIFQAMAMEKPVYLYENNSLSELDRNTLQERYLSQQKK